MKRIGIVINLFIILLLACTSTATVVSKPNVLPFDSAVVAGELPNGLHYYIRANAKPEKRVELRLVVNAGSVLEDDAQRGLAHFVEHLAFDNTAHFANNSLVGVLESMGMRFGNDLNASTSYDETIYRLQVPTDKPVDLDTGLQVLEDWAHGVILDREGVEKERKVITEEWRTDRGAAERIREEHFKSLFAGSRYAVRKPIGELQIIKNASPDTIRKFYTDWYRPDLLAVVVVGDIDPALVEQKIKERFSGLTKPANPRPRTEYKIPANTTPIVSVVTDKEATSSSFRLYIKRPVRPLVYLDDYRALLVEYLFHSMLQARLGEIAQQPDAPFLEAYSSQGRIVRTMEAVVLGAEAKEGMIEPAMETVLKEVERVKRFGFMPAELEREKQNILAGIEQSYNERDKRNSSALTQEYIRHYLEKEASPGIEYEYDLYKRFIPEISLEEINKLFTSLFPEQNRVLLVALPERKDLAKPDPAKLLSIIEKVKTDKLDAYADQTLDRPLIDVGPVKGKIVKEETIPELGMTVWSLSNGARVMLKPTDFKNDEIMMRAWSAGGSSLVADADYIPAVSAASLVSLSGPGQFNRIQLDKKLAGKEVAVAPWIDELFEGISGSTRPKDITTLFELVYLYFTEPKIDPDAFLAYKNKLTAALAQRDSSPENVFSDLIQTTLGQNHLRIRPWTIETLKELNMEASLRIYQDRFRDAGDFNFLFVGNIDPGALKPLVETFLAGLPSTGRKETWKDIGVKRPPGIVEKTMKMGKDPKSSVAIIFHGGFNWQLPEVVTLHALTEVTQMRLTNTIREKEGGAYSLNAGESPRRLPTQEYLFFISFDTDPARVEELTASVYAQLKDLKAKGPTAEELNKAMEILLKEREVNLKNNGFWAEVIKNYYTYGEPPTRILEYMGYIKELTAEKLKIAAGKYFNEKSLVRVVLYPEEGAGK